MRHLCLIFGDQLNHDSLLFENFDPQQDSVWMAEVSGESRQPPSGFQRTLVFLSAMRHFAAGLRQRHVPLFYYALSDGFADFESALEDCLQQLADDSPHKLRAVLPGDATLVQRLHVFAKQHALKLEWLPDNHFLSEPGEFSHWLKGRKAPRMEHWYRQLRKSRKILMDDAGKPLGGRWNFDQHNRKAFPAQGPAKLPQFPQASPDKHSRAVMQDIADYLPELYGEHRAFGWPVTPKQAEAVLQHFIEACLPHFGDYQDAMWQDQALLYHAGLASSLNLKLIHPQQVIDAAVAAYKDGRAPLNAVEGFVRQILGWREYVRGLYWQHRHHWPEMNFFQHVNPLPDCYWHGDTDLNCLQQAIGQVLDIGYGHHIQRLMVTGLMALLLRVDPQAVHRWYLGMYVDAVTWVEVPNTLGMSQFADGGILGSKPYIASGNYINRMSNYCKHCRYQPGKASGEDACPVTTLYWRFIADHEAWLGQHPRLAMQVRHWHNKPAKERAAISADADKVFARLLPQD